MTAEALSSWANRREREIGRVVYSKRAVNASGLVQAGLRAQGLVNLFPIGMINEHEADFSTFHLI